MKLYLYNFSQRILKSHPDEAEKFNAQENIHPEKFKEALEDPDNEILAWEESAEFLDAKSKQAKEDMRDSCMRECHNAILAIVENDNATTRAALEAHITELKQLEG